MNEAISGDTTRLRQTQNRGSIPTDLNIHESELPRMRDLFNETDEDFRKLPKDALHPLHHFYHNCFVNALLRDHASDPSGLAKNKMSYQNLDLMMRHLLQTYEKMPVYSGPTRRVVDQESFQGNEDWKPGDIFVDPAIMCTEKPTSKYVDPDNWINLKSGHPVIMHFSGGAIGADCGSSPGHFDPILKDLHEVHYPPLVPFKITKILRDGTRYHVKMEPVSMEEAKTHQDQGGKFHTGPKEEVDLFKLRGEYAKWLDMPEEWHTLRDVEPSDRDEDWQEDLSKHTSADIKLSPPMRVPFKDLDLDRFA